jgi:hypothetical protein
MLPFALAGFEVAHELPEGPGAFAFAPALQPARSKAPTKTVAATANPPLSS